MNRIWSLFSKSFSLSHMLGNRPQILFLVRSLSVRSYRSSVVGAILVHRVSLGPFVELVASLLCEDYEISYLGEQVG